MNRKYIDRIIEQAINIPTGQEKKAPFTPNPAYILPGNEIGLQYRGKEYVWNPSTNTYWKRPKNGNNFQWRDMQTDVDYYKTSSEIKDAFEKYRQEKIDDEAEASVKAAKLSAKQDPITHAEEEGFTTDVPDTDDLPNWESKVVKDAQGKEVTMYKEKDPSWWDRRRQRRRKRDLDQQQADNLKKPVFCTDGSYVYTKRKDDKQQLVWMCFPLINVTTYVDLMNNSKWTLASKSQVDVADTLQPATFTVIESFKDINTGKQIKKDSNGNYYLIKNNKFYYSYNITTNDGKSPAGPYFSTYVKLYSKVDGFIGKHAVGKLNDTIDKIAVDTVAANTPVKLGDPTTIVDVIATTDATGLGGGAGDQGATITKDVTVQTAAVYKEGGGYQYKIENDVYYFRKGGKGKWLTLKRKGVNYDKAKVIIDAAATIEPPADSVVKTNPAVTVKTEPVKKEPVKTEPVKTEPVKKGNPAELKQANDYLKESYNYADTTSTKLHERTIDFKMSKLQEYIKAAPIAINGMRAAINAMKPDYENLRDKTTDPQVKTICIRSIYNLNNTLNSYAKYWKKLKEIEKLQDTIIKGIEKKPNGYTNKNFIITGWKFWRPGEKKVNGWGFKFTFKK